MASFNKDGSPKGGRPVLRKPGGNRLKTNAAFENEPGRDRRAPLNKPVPEPNSTIMDSFMDIEGGEE